VWHISNNLSDVILPFLHFVGWFIVIVLVETQIIRRLICRKKRENTQTITNLDDDVQKEEDRVR
jgi:hypothetical protein